MRIPGDRESTAQDAVQATVITAAKNCGKYDISRPAYPWLRTILLNHIRNLKRKISRYHIQFPSVTDVTARAAKAQRTSDDDDPLGRLGAYQEDPDPTDGDAFDALLAPLSDSDQQILRLTYQDRLSSAELAAHLGCTEGAAYTRLSRARDRLRQASQATGNGEN
jgi:RNA polymerase sigma factor (sigma-70 family)